MSKWRKRVAPQCGSIYGSAGGYTVWFCARAAAHKGDHRAGGRQWTQAGERVPCTIPLEDVEHERWLP